MKLYFIRHAPTLANIHGSIVQNYDETDILDFDKDEWLQTVGQHIPFAAMHYIYASPTRRCMQTAYKLFGPVVSVMLPELKEFDCSALGNRKFWTLTKDEFETLVTITPQDMQSCVEKMLYAVKYIGGEHNILVGHGMYIRYLYHYFTGNKDISAYDVINSNGFSFSNLDLLIIDTATNSIEYYPYKQPIKHE